MINATEADGGFSDAVRLFVERHAAIGLTLVRMRRESSDDPPGDSSLNDLLKDLEIQLADAKRPRRAEVARFARSCSPPLDVAGDTYRSAFHAVVDIAKRVLLAHYNDDLAPLTFRLADVSPKSRTDGRTWSEVRESIVHQAEVHRINRHLNIAAGRAKEALRYGCEPKPSDQGKDLWLSRLALLGRRKPNEGAKAMWRRLSATSYRKGRAIFSYDGSFGLSKPPGGWNGAQHDARKKLQTTLIKKRPILDYREDGQHVLNWRLPRWFLAELDRDYPQRST